MNNLKRPFYYDLSFWVLIFSNSATIVLAVVEAWSLITIMMVYWVQSCIIGFFNVARIMALKKFSTDGFYMNGKSVLPTEKTKRSTASFFALHYGFFHVLYAVFLFYGLEGVNVYYIFLGGIVFFFDHFFSFRYNKERDEKKITNIGRLMFFPYARVIPMHVVLLVVRFFSSEAGPLVLFLGLKTAADALMHVVEHRL